tara:strand:+ start:454 stop:588 length:135 start_codon:yes stop_codon:yes gene_type:complete
LLDPRDRLLCGEVDDPDDAILNMIQMALWQLMDEKSTTEVSTQD